jgi:hypothetical protein
MRGLYAHSELFLKTKNSKGLVSSESIIEEGYIC